MYGEETNFTEQMKDFEAIENDPNKNVDEQEVEEDMASSEQQRSESQAGKFGVFGYTYADDVVHSTHYDTEEEAKAAAVELAQDLNGEDLSYVEVWQADEQGRFGNVGEPVWKRSFEDELATEESKANEEEVDEEKVNEKELSDEEVAKFVSDQMSGTKDIDAIKRTGDLLSAFVKKFHLNTETAGKAISKLKAAVATYKSTGNESKTNEEEVKVEEEVKTFVCDGCGKTLPLSDLSLSKGNKNYCPRCRGKANEENTDTVSNDSAFEQVVNNFAQIENDPNKNVDEQEVNEQATEFVCSECGEVFDVYGEEEAKCPACGHIEESKTVAEQKLSVDDVKKLFKSIDKMFAKHLTGLYGTKRQVALKGKEVGLELSDEGKEVLGESKIDEQDDSKLNEKEGIPKSILLDALEIQLKDENISFEQIVKRLLDIPVHKEWFDKEYAGNEFDLRQELEDKLTDGIEDEPEPKFSGPGAEMESKVEEQEVGED